VDETFFHALNEAMRVDDDGPFSPLSGAVPQLHAHAFAPLIHHLNGALRLMDRNLQPLTLYRGVDFEDCTLQDASCRNPPTFYLPGFTSTSLEMAQALKFSVPGARLRSGGSCVEHC
jgi:hypothetical protein